MDKDWYRINNVENILSPSLVVFPERIEANIKLMIQIAGGTDMLRPHIKTHKIAEIIKMELQTANVNFKDDDKDEVSKRSVGRKPPAKRPANEKSNSKKSN